MAIKMSGSIPADNNGLSTIYGALISDPQRQHVVIAVVDTGKLTTDTDTGVVSPTVRIHHAEVVLPESIPAARVMMQRALEAETSTETIWDDYVTVCAGSCYIDGIQAHANGTHVLTVKGRKNHG